MSIILRPLVVFFLSFTVITGGLYPLVVNGAAQILFPQQANGSLIVLDGQVRGSALIGQSFADPRYFWGRPSATAPFPYNSAASSGSNLGPLNPALTENVAARVSALQIADPDNDAPIPVDLVTSSASGLDPHISPAAAEFQVGRVARARGLSEDRVRQLVAEQTTQRTVGILGEATVNVLELNLALDAIK